MGNSIYKDLVFLPPDPATYTTRVPRKVIFIKTSSGKKIPAYFLRARERTRVTFIYSHGNAADIGAMNDFLTLLHENINVNILHYEYIGYGLAKSEGHATESHVYESIEAGLNWLVNTQGLEFEDVIAFGTSVGSGPTVHLTAKYKRLKGLILECPFTSAIRVVMDNAIGSILRPVDMFVNSRKIPKVRCPVMIFHGNADTVVPFSHSLDLWARIPDRLKYKNVWVKGADHHDMIEVLSPKVYVTYIIEFIRHCEDFQARDDRQAELRKLASSERGKKYIKKKPGVACLVLEDPEDDEDEDVRDDDGYYDIYKLV